MASSSIIGGARTMDFADSQGFGIVAAIGMLFQPPHCFVAPDFESASVVAARPAELEGWR